MGELGSTKPLKRELHNVCGLKYDEYWKAVHIDKTMSQEAFDDWFKKYCAQCRWMSEVCMFGET